MPRGRHRNPEPLHRLLTPTTVAGVSVAGAAAAWLPAEPLPLRILVALTAAAGVAGAFVMRSWDRAAGRRVAELARERVKDEWKTEERIAELESDLEEARVMRARLDTKLRAKRVELAALRGEHAALLRRYATAETERASALERRRLLAIEASAAPSGDGSGSGSGPRELAPVTEERTSAGAPTAVGYARANVAMSALVRKAEVTHSRPAAAAVPARRPAATMAPYSPPRRTASRVEGGFDFFGTKNAEQARAVIEAVQNEDLADVVGAEVLAVHKAESAQGGPAEPEFKRATPEQRAVGQVIDLTAHDETEPIDVVRLRTAIS
ncbi:MULTISPECIES: hypothetical protein [Streptomyces]|uniref:hypothetical protein n=1 Tax=Streptomyces TaxID=1883 RepID=UPI00017E8F2C|nr:MULTISPECIES: hypothetical protein [Streptomyces]AKL67216.1 hypothetical protein M444_19555 [Streptomyces sp. Mg1]EDX25485.1 hypothetical protein SSAG_05375 [Streptomyces sp. Mg1]WBY21374.1 hypothetical protein PET44_18225 [Streptomyces goshikiensis]